MACHGPIPEQKISGPAHTAATAPPSLAGGPWAYHPVTRRRSYVIEQRAVVTTRADTLTRTDSVNSYAELAFTLMPGGTHLSGSVGSFRVQAPGRMPATPQSLVLPFAFAGELSPTGQQVSIAAKSVASPCSSPATSVLQSLRDLWFHPPDTLRIRGTWDDTASYIICRDGILLHVSARRVFRVTSASVRDGRVSLTIQRSSRTTVAGSGQQSGEAVEIAGISSGQMTYDLDPESGELLGASGASSLELKLKSRLRIQDAIQVTETRIRPRSVDKP